MSVFSEFKVFNNKTWSSHFLLWKKNKYYQKQSEVFVVWLAILWSKLLLLLICRHWMAAKIFCFLNQIVRNFLFNPFMHNIEKWPNFSSLSTKPTQWSNTLKQFVGSLPTNCLSVFDHFVGLALKGIKILRCLQFHEFQVLQFWYKKRVKFPNSTWCEFL